jgi:tetratricopeptide (TPR) repeat protein
MAAIVALRRLLATSASAPPPSFSAVVQAAESQIHALHADTRAALASNDFPAALASAEECAAAAEAHFGRRHPATASALNNLAQVHRAAGRPSSALPHMEGALEIYEATLGAEHASTATALANLGSLRVALAAGAKGMERATALEEARGLHEAALTARKRAFGERHAQVGVSLYLCATVARLQKRFEDAERLLGESVALLRDAGAGARRAAATALNNQGVLLKERGRLAAAEAAYREALAIRRAELGAAHEDSVATQYSLAECVRAAGREGEAVALQKEILDLLGVEKEGDCEGGGGGGGAGERPPPTLA